jgi:hypothetical protein
MYAQKAFLLYIGFNAIINVLFVHTCMFAFLLVILGILSHFSFLKSQGCVFKLKALSCFNYLDKMSTFKLLKPKCQQQPQLPIYVAIT